MDAVALSKKIEHLVACAEFLGIWTLSDKNASTTNIRLVFAFGNVNHPNSFTLNISTIHLKINLRRYFGNCVRNCRTFAVGNVAADDFALVVNADKNKSSASISKTAHLLRQFANLSRNCGFEVHLVAFALPYEVLYAVCGNHFALIIWCKDNQNYW